MIRLCHDNYIPGNFTFDSFYTCYEIQNDINALQNADGTPHGYVGDLKFNRKMTFKGVEQKASEFASTIPPEDRKPVTVDGVKQWYLTVCVKMPNVGHKVCIVILWKYKNDAKRGEKRLSQTGRSVELRTDYSSRNAVQGHPKR